MIIITSKYIILLCARLAGNIKSFITPMPTLDGDYSWPDTVQYRTPII